TNGDSLSALAITGIVITSILVSLVLCFGVLVLVSAIKQRAVRHTRPRFTSHQSSVRLNNNYLSSTNSIASQSSMLGTSTLSVNPEFLMHTNHTSTPSDMSTSDV
ncbi:hypothetical protein SARC_08726, partial [Sphaeroforma arctica JP610]